MIYLHRNDHSKTTTINSFIYLIGQAEDIFDKYKLIRFVFCPLRLYIAHLIKVNDIRMKFYHLALNKRVDRSLRTIVIISANRSG